MKRAILVTAQFAVAAGAFWLIWRKVDLGAAWALLSGLSTKLIVVIFVLIYTQIAIVAWRLLFVVKAIGKRISFPACFLTLMSGAFAGQTPAGLIGGDVARAWYLVRGGLPLRDAATAVTIDRVLGFAALVVIVALTDFPLFFLVSSTWMRAAIVAISLAAVGAVVAVLALQLLPPSLRRFWFIRWLADLSALLGTMLRHRRDCAAVMVLGFSGHFLSVGAIYLLLVGFGASLTVPQSIVLTAFPLLLSLLPISVGGWGVREGSLIAAFTLVGVPAEVTLAASITFGVILLASSLPGGLVLMNAVPTREAKTKNSSAPCP